MTNLTAQDVIDLLQLQPLEGEGGYYRRTYTGHALVHESRVGPGTAEPISSAIFYLITQDSFSQLHRLTTDEIYHFYLGASVDLCLLGPDTAHQKTVTLGPDLVRGERPQVVVPGGTWQGARIRGQGGFALLGTTMAPAFDPSHFELGDRDRLAAEFPDARDLIERFIPSA